jgi:hypothetical protein
MGIRETASLPGQSINMRGADMCGPVASEVSISHVICKKDDDVGFGFRTGMKC